MCKEFIKEVYSILHPKKFNEIASRPAKKAIWFFTKVIFFSFILMGLLFLPKLVKLPSSIGEEISKFESLQLSGNASTSEPIVIPDKDPLIRIDTKSNEIKLKTERLLISKDSVYTRILSTDRITIDELKNPGEHKATVSKFVALLIIFAIPSLLFYSFLVNWLVYFLLIILAGTVVFLLIDLTHFRKKWKETFKIACYGSLGMIAVEILTIPFKPFWMFPIFSFIGVRIYATGLVLLLALTGTLTAFYHYWPPKKPEE